MRLQYHSKPRPVRRSWTPYLVAWAGVGVLLLWLALAGCSRSVQPADPAEIQARRSTAQFIWANVRPVVLDIAGRLVDLAVGWVVDRAVGPAPVPTTGGQL